MDETGQNSQPAVLSPVTLTGASILALNCTDTLLIAAGLPIFQLLSIKQIDHSTQVSTLCDFRTIQQQSALPRHTIQPKDVSWNRQYENKFATTNSTMGCLHVWDAARLSLTDQLPVHNGLINRIQFHPTNPDLLLTASQDGYAKLIDLRMDNTERVAKSFRHSSTEAFRDIDINPSATDKFAAVVSDQHSVPIWDFRLHHQPVYSVSTRDRVSYILWNPNEPSWIATGGFGGHDRTIRIWDTDSNDTRQEPLFTVHAFRQIVKFSWRPACRYHIASVTRFRDQRIHVWDIRRPYLPQALFCHHQSDVEDFLWRFNSDSLFSIDRNGSLVHAHFSSAIKSDRLVSLFSLNATSKGSVQVVQPNIDNDYVRALYKEQHISAASTSLTKLYSHETMSTFNKWNKTIDGRSILGIYTNFSHDDSVELFHQFARKWILGQGEKSYKVLGHICDTNSIVAEELNRPDLRATWQVIKMLYLECEASRKRRARSSKTSRSLTKGFRASDSTGGGGSRHHHPQLTRKSIGIDEQLSLEEQRLNDDFNSERRVKSKEQRALSDSKLTVIDDLDTYIVRDILTDDILFISPEDLLANGHSVDEFQDESCDIETMRTGFPLPITPSATPTIDGDYANYSIDRMMRKSPDIVMIDDDDLKNDEEYEDIDNNMLTSTRSLLPDSSETFFTIDESYCPTVQKYSLNFDQIIRDTLCYYVENNELQMAVHLLLVLYPQMSEEKRIELFNGMHLQWIVTYIELLQKMRLFVKAQQVIRHCIEVESIPLHYNAADYEDTIILPMQPPSLPRLPSFASPPTPVPKQSPQPVPREFVCSICRIPCRGLFSFCGICFHGGHIEHIETWFKKHDECSFGCGHRCRDYRSQNQPTRILQRMISKSASTIQK